MALPIRFSALYRDTIFYVSAADSFSSDFPVAAYRQLAELRYSIRRFLRFSEQAARENGFEPQQHQLLLAVKGLPPGLRPTITAISVRLGLRHHSTVELVNRMVERGVITRRHSELDRREALIELTREGEEVLRKLSILHWEELKHQAPELSDALGAIVSPPESQGDI